MPPRKRKAENQGLEPNVYTDKKPNGATYYTYVHPIDHWKEPLGKDREAANRTARALNSALERAGVDPTQRAPVIRGETMDQIIDEYLAVKLPTLKEGGSRKTGKNYILRLRDLFAKKPIRALTVRDLAEAMEPLNVTSYKKMRQFLIEIFNFALSRGYLPHNYGNPAAVLEVKRTPRPKRERLTLDHFRQIHAMAPPWLQIGMELMLVTTLRPNDVVNLKFDQVIDGALYTEIRKVQKFLRFELRESDHKIIARARDDVLSPYIVHRMPARKSRKISKLKTHPTQLTVDHMSREFSAIRDQLGIGGEHPPTLYEIRSLASWLYQQQGINPKELMAHTDQDMTDHYIFDRRQEFETVAVGLNVKL